MADTASPPPGPAVRRTPRRRPPTGAPPPPPFPLPAPAGVADGLVLFVEVLLLEGGAPRVGVMKAR